MTKIAQSMICRRRLLLGAGAGGLLLPALPALAAVQAGTVEIEQVQVAFLGSGNLGGGTLHFQGKSYRFSVGGLGVGGIGVSKMKATGVVYDMATIGQFAGVYGQARMGAVAADMSTGGLWLQNPNGVVLSLSARRKGLALSTGADAVVIDLK